MTPGAPRAFLTAEWRHLAMLNYRVDPALLWPFVPAGTMLDLWDGAAFMSVVGFQFRKTSVLGVPIPLHRDFPEINLRLYVRREVHRDARRAVTFIRELVPRRAIASTAKLVYNEPYLARRMRERIDESPSGISVSYEWRSSRWGGVHASSPGPLRPLLPESEENFIAQHFWGYTRQRNGSTIEYHVAHPAWNVTRASESSFDGDFAGIYPQSLAAELRRPPDSAFIADGSAVTVYQPVRLL